MFIIFTVVGFVFRYSIISVHLRACWSCWWVRGRGSVRGRGPGGRVEHGEAQSGNLRGRAAAAEAGGSSPSGRGASDSWHLVTENCVQTIFFVTTHKYFFCVLCSFNIFTLRNICSWWKYFCQSQIILYAILIFFSAFTYHNATTLVLSLRPRACHITASVAASAGLSGLVITGVGSRVEKKLVLSQNLK